MRFGESAPAGLLGIGVDLVEIERFRRLSSSSPFFSRVFGPEELDYCMNCRDPYPHFAAMFAAKEAVVKALSQTVQVPVWQVRIDHGPNGEPEAHVARLDDVTIHVSMTHSSIHGAAIAVATRGPAAMQGHRMVDTMIDELRTALAREVIQ
ncbi:MAG: holo-ACP synthase [Candidatus Thorarchaeota archaeon]